MSLYFYLPDEDLKFLIKRFLFIKSDNNVVKLNDRFIPDGCSGLVYNFHQNIFIKNGNNEFRLPKSFLTYPSLEPIQIKCYFPFNSMVVLFNSSVLSALYRINFRNYANNLYIPDDITGLNSLYNKLIDISDEEKILEIQNHLREKFFGLDYKPDIIDELYKRIMETDGTVPIETLLGDLNAKERSLRRNFLNRVGINAKKLARIRRINYVWDLINCGNITDYQSLVVYCNYSDQAHFINDFKKMTGETPKRFFSRNLSEVGMISGKLGIRLDDMRN